MCEPETIGSMAFTAAETAMVGISAASAAVSYAGQQAQADAISASAKQSNDAQMSQLQIQRQQINEQAADQMSERAKQAQAMDARLRVSAGESGVSGPTVDRLSNEIYANEDQDITHIQKNRSNSMQQSGATADGINAQTQSMLNQAPRPSIIGSGLQIAGTAADVQIRKANRTVP